jgi:hypothetical protein
VIDAVVLETETGTRVIEATVVETGTETGVVAMVVETETEIE